MPTIAGAAVALFGKPRPAAELLAVGLMGLAATVGILLYELRNSQLYDGVVARARELERRLALPATTGAETGGVYTERPPATTRLFGVVDISHRRGVALVYGAALAGWTYLVVWGALRALDLAGARKIGALVGALVAAAVVVDVDRMHRDTT